MSLLRVKAKVLLTSEEGMEIEERDMGTMASSKQWVWRQQAFLVGEIYKITAYTKTRSLIQMYDGERMLVEEPFDELCDKWEKARTDEFSYPIEDCEDQISSSLTEEED